MTDPEVPKRRLTVPLFRTWFDGEDCEALSERLEVAPDIWLAPLDDAERERVADSLLLDPLNSAWFRLEIHALRRMAQPNRW